MIGVVHQSGAMSCPIALLDALTAEELHCPVITAGHPDYDRYRRVWNGIADRQPLAIVRPQDVEDVQRAVRAAASSRSLLAVRGGGHSLPGLSTCNDGLVIDLSLIRSVVIDNNAQTVDVGGGALLGDLDRATIPKGYIVPAGVISHTGVAGLTLGGGMGWASRKYGLTIDSLLGAEIVIASGDVTWTSPTWNPELLLGHPRWRGKFRYCHPLQVPVASIRRDRRRPMGLSDRTGPEGSVRIARSGASTIP